MSRCPSQDSAASHTIGEIVRKFGRSYVDKYKPSNRIKKILSCIGNCRTAALGGHYVECTQCDYKKVVYNSCGNSHCPQCQSLKRALWVDKTRHRQLPVRHYHVIFTLPHELNDLIYYNQKKFYNLLFQVSSETIRYFAGPGQCGMIATLHTWGSNLSYHPHIHCIVADGYFDGEKWQRGKRHNGCFFVKYSELRKKYQELFIKRSITLIEESEDLYYEGRPIESEDYEKISKIYTKASLKSSWSVRVETPIYGEQKLVEYLGRYVSRVAITNNRIISITEEEVTYSYKVYSKQEKGKAAPMTSKVMSGAKFLQRFVQHIPPYGFHRIRYYGVYNYSQKRRLESARSSINGEVAEAYTAPIASSMIKQLIGIHPDQCPSCKQYMTFVTKPIAEEPSHRLCLLGIGRGDASVRIKPRRNRALVF